MAKAADTKWDESLLRGKPARLLHWFATECARRAVARVTEQGATLPKSVSNAVETVRRGLADTPDEKALQKARRSLSKELDPDDAACFERDSDTHAATHAAICCAQAAATGDPAYAASHAAWQLLYTVECLESIYGLPSGERLDAEKRALVDLLQHLDAAWSEHGDDAPRVLARTPAEP